jgi:peptide/nickel transport system permease protein
MLRHAFRRLLWVFPSVLGVTLLSFLVLARVPDPVTRSADTWTAAERADRLRRRFVDLPLFVNLAPKDAHARTEQAVETILAADPASDAAASARRELSRIGGVGLPYVLTTFDRLAPEGRTLLVAALAPVGRRMGIGSHGELDGPERAVLFWGRYWETRGVEFRAATVRSAVRRYAAHGEEARAEDLRALDTFALPALMEELGLPSNRSEVERAQRLIELIAHATERDDRIAAEAGPDEARACVERWQRWWGVYETDYQSLAGLPRMSATFLETRFGKWALEAVTQGLGRDESGRGVFATLLTRARVSLAVLLIGLALAYAAAIPLGALSALLRGSAVDRVVGWLVLLPYALSPAVLGALGVALGWHRGPTGSPSFGALALAGALLALGLVAEPMRQQRAALLPVLTGDYVRAAMARGAGRLRVVLAHGLRLALFPLATRSALELPVAWTGVFVLERALGLPGLGDATLAAVERGDTAWLMAMVVAGAGWAVVALVLSDVVYSWIDPRLRQAVLGRHRRAA